MADKPVTREEKYFAYLTGDYKGELPKPITRKEKYLYELCLKGIGGEISPEEIKNAVNEYLENNPVKPGATAEQAQQIEQNKTDISSLKVETSSLKEDLVDDLNEDGTYIYKKNKVNSEYSSVRGRYEINVPAKEGNNTIYCSDMGNETLTTYLLNSDKSAIAQKIVTFSNGLASFTGVSNTAYIRVFGNNITSSSVGYSNVKTRDSVRKTLTEHSNAIDTNASAITTTDKRVDVLDYYYENGVEGDGSFNYIIGEYSAEYNSSRKMYQIFIPIENENTIYLYCSDISNGTYNGMFIYSDDEKTQAVATVDVTFTNGYSTISVNNKHKWVRLITGNIKESSVCYKLEKKTAIRKEINDLKVKTVTTNVDRYLFVSDIHFGFSGDYSPNTHVSQLFDAIRTENEIKKLKAVFIVGDLISNTESYNFKSYAKKFVNSIKEMGIKVFVLHGNHDCWSPDDFREQFENSMDFVVNTPNLRYECVNTWGTDYYTGDLNLITADMKDVDENVAQYMLSTRDSKPTIVVSHYPTSKTNFMSLLTDDVICLFGGHVHSPKVSDFNGKTLYLDGSISTIGDGTQYRTFRILECSGGNITTYVVAPKLEMFNQTERVVDEAVLLYTKSCDVYDIN